MATREDNLKKINEELEKLSDEELEKVAGGSWYDLTPPKGGGSNQDPYFESGRVSK